ncbi:MAG: hypothetical protein NC399_05960 [Muribaculum sp.]|nr:hypothetical protein [Muribaculum sp.]
MSAKTKIVVLHMKELIYTGIFATLGILLVIMLVIMFLPKEQEETPEDPNTPPQTVSPDAADNVSAAAYIPGVYTTELVLGGQAIDVEVIVGQESITSIRLMNMSESVTTMYPLLEPALESICTQVYETQSLDNITYTAESKYTSLVLLEAIRNSLNKAQPQNNTENE